MARLTVCCIWLIAAASAGIVSAQNRPTRLPVPSGTVEAQDLPNSGQQITPTAPTGARFEPLNPGLADFPSYVAGQAVTTVTSPDHKTLLILTSGYNLMNATSGPNQGNTIAADSTEYVFVYNISNGDPVKTQVIKVPNTYQGIVFDPTGKTFYVSGGVDDDVHIYDLGPAGWAERSTSPITLGHNNATCAALIGCGNGLAVSPEAAGLAISPDSSTLVVANYYNDSISILKNSLNGWTKSGDLDLRPGKINSADSGVPGGEYPLWVVIQGSSTAYVSSIRDREIDVVQLAGTPTVSARIKVTGQPNKMVLNGAQTLLFVAEDESDSVAVINTANNGLVTEIPVGPPTSVLNQTPNLSGNNTNSVALSPDEQTLYVTNGNMNDVAVVALSNTFGNSTVVGLIPTGRYPNSVSLSGNGGYMFVVNGKSPTGPNTGYCHGGSIPGLSTAVCDASNQYDLQLIKAGFQSFPTPTASELASLTAQVARNNHLGRTVSSADAVTMGTLRSKIQHVIYIIKENRTYDQILGDLPVGNGDPDLTEFGQATTPNLHNLAQTFVTLDNFYDRSEVSMDGWPWSVSARSPDVVEKQVTVNYAGRGLSNDSEGTNRNINVSLPTLTQRLQADPLNPEDPDLLPGTADTSAPDGPGDQENTGYLWNAALRAGLTIRNYGFFIDLARYQTLPEPYAALQIPLLENPFASGTTVAYPTNAALAPYTDPYFRGFDNSFPDYDRFTEWQRDFTKNYANGGLPQLSFVRFMHDHTGNFSTAIDGVNTPELDQADNDYAVGLLVQQIANSQYNNNTLIFVIEDDSQDGADHVDSHRSIAFIVGPYVKQGAVVSTQYNTVDFVRTIEDVLGIGPLNLNDAVAVPMADVFDLNQATWSFTATPSTLLESTTLPITFPSSANVMRPTHDAAHWAKATEGMDFSAEDRFDFGRYNRILWKGLMGDKPYPEAPSGSDLRRNRAELLARYRQALQQQKSN
ncbi:MAG: bifunctional YncE family protein/alkaline phosphatase family protein [Bryobacteraceae bacterium]